MGLITNLRDKYITAPLVKQLTSELSKGTSDTVQRWAQPLGFNDQVFQKRKPGSKVTYEMLRSMAGLHDISRACINIRKHQITQLNWNITPIDDNAPESILTHVPALKSFFYTIGGYNTKIRKLLDMMVEDYLVLDAVVLERRRTRSGAFLGLIPADPATIKILVDENGSTPHPPQPAYEQWIRGTKVGEFTASQLIYDMLNPKTDSPYGFSVMEALVTTVEESIRSRMYSLAYFSDGSMPDGFYELPEGWTIEQIKSFQSHFDSMMAGDQRQQHKVKFMPSSGGKGFQPTKEFDFSGMEPYLAWLTKVTATMFGVMPSELGFTDSVNKATSMEQTEIAKRNSIKPLAQAIEELFNEIIWRERIALTDNDGVVIDEIGPFPELKFTFEDLDNKDELIDSQVTEAMVKIGAISVDEWRKDKGLDPIGLAPYILTSQGPILASQVGTVLPAGDTATPDKKPENKPASDQAEALNTSPDQELKRWEKKALTDLKEGKSFRKFYSEVLDNYTLVHLEHDLQKCTDREQVKELFSTWKQSLGEGITYDAERLFKKLDELA